MERCEQDGGAAALLAFQIGRPGELRGHVQVLQVPACRTESGVARDLHPRGRSAARQQARDLDHEGPLVGMDVRAMIGDADLAAAGRPGRVRLGDRAEQDRPFRVAVDEHGRRQPGLADQTVQTRDVVAEVLGYLAAYGRRQGLVGHHSRQVVVEKEGDAREARPRGLEGVEPRWRDIAADHHQQPLRALDQRLRGRVVVEVANRPRNGLALEPRPQIIVGRGIGAALQDQHGVVGACSVPGQRAGHPRADRDEGRAPAAKLARLADRRRKAH